MALDPGRTVDELKELQELTGDENGAQRVAWTETWARAREWLDAKLAALPVEQESDEAANQWRTLRAVAVRLERGRRLDAGPGRAAAAARCRRRGAPGRGRGVRRRPRPRD